MATQASISPKTEAFAGKVLGDTSGMLVTVMAAIGDRLGLFKMLATQGPATSTELAARAGIQERYAREWLGGMATAGYLQYEPGSRRFSLPPEHVPVLAQEKGPFFFGGVHQMLTGMVRPLSHLLEAFRQGGGVPQSAYDENMWEGMTRFSSGWFENLLVQMWIPAVPDIQAKLQRGARVADVGCGYGWALIKLAQTFPNSRYVGYDIYAPMIERARANARAAGVADRVSYVALDAAQGIPEQFDLIATFDVVHDSPDPAGLLRAIRQALRPDGTYLLLEINCSEKLEENAGPLGAMFHGFSVLYCMTTSLARGGVGLGTLGVPEAKARELCQQAGFSHVRRLPLENPFNSLYEVKP